MPEAYVGAGSNIDPERRLQAAVAALEQRFGAVRCSGVYRSRAVGTPAADYLNLVVRFTTDLPPDELKLVLRELETAAGRARLPAGARDCPLDLDLLVYGRRVDAQRRLPHDDVLRRAFVLAPLAELAPGLAHPVTGESIAAAWAALERRGPVPRRVAGPAACAP
jgi:2-amino-4-hydroxy-6-hydroxymethyldihydropteridine diphosphokinase